ncbi:MAG: CoA-binding protein, partial [Bdellovibrionales bacterium]|nr:CoA-binding protein [Bdellovibrionales bacterium]
MSQNVAILGASAKPDRYSYKAFQMLKEYGHTPFPIHPTLQEIEGHAVFSSLESLKESGTPIDTLTIYLRPDRSTPLVNE